MNKYIYINLKGGLGNQLFQYCAYLYLSRSNLGSNVTFSFFSDFTNDTYSRNQVIQNLLTVPVPITSILPTNAIRINSENLSLVAEYLNSQIDGNFLVDGYFQSVDNVRESKIEDLFCTKDCHELVAVHVRRSDYGHHGLLPFKYYAESLETLNYPDFVVYSDELNYSKFMFSNSKGFQGVLQPSNLNPENDFMELFRHKCIVMANSSFSLMPSYISDKKNSSKIVAPSRWSFIGNPTGPGYLRSWKIIETDLIKP